MRWENKFNHGFTILKMSVFQIWKVDTFFLMLYSCCFSSVEVYPKIYIFSPLFFWNQIILPNNRDMRMQSISLVSGGKCIGIIMAIK